MSGSFLYPMENGNTGIAIMSRQMFLFKTIMGQTRVLCGVQPLLVTAFTNRCHSSGVTSSPGNSTEVKPNFSKFRIRIGYSLPNK